MKKVLESIVQSIRIRKGYFLGLKMLALSILFAQFTYAQVEITGKVTGNDGETLPGVNIIEKGTSNGTITDMDGNYTISVASTESVLIYSMVGMLVQEAQVGERTIIDIILGITM